MLIYRQILKVRARRWRLAPGAAVPTVCVGNVTVGGTGKTPHTELILRLLQSSARWGGRQLAMLSRGYKRSSKGFQTVAADSTAAFAGDEPLQIKKKFPAVTVAVCKDRVEGCKKLVGAAPADCPAGEASPIVQAEQAGAAAGAGVIVLDDAFQYNRLHASLNIVLVDWNRPVFKDSLLPLGRLRDLPSRIFDADIIIVSKCPRGLEAEEKAAFAAGLRLRDYDPAACTAVTPAGVTVRLLFTYIDYCELVPVFPEGDARYAYAQSAVMLTGIANDSPMRAYLSDTYKIAGALSFPDHHRFTRSDISRIAAAVRSFPTAALITTEKDAQRLLDFGVSTARSSGKGPSGAASGASAQSGVPARSLIPHEVRERLFALPIRAAFSSDAELSVLTSALERL